MDICPQCPAFHRRNFAVDKNYPMQVILGSGGAISWPLATELANYTNHVRCCSRTPHELPAAPGVVYEHTPLDLLDRDATKQAVTGATVIYLTAGLAYRTKVWQRDWPVVIDNVLAACTAANAKLVFFDNVYALNPTEYGRMTEQSPLQPTSAKGRVRKAVLDKIWAAHRAGEVTACVARSADFYGPEVSSGLLNSLVLDKIAGGEKPMWIGDPDARHSFTYTPDAGRFTALLGNDDRAWGQTWNLPTAGPAWTVREWADRAGAQVGRNVKLFRMPKALFWLLGRFNADLRELWDVRAQFAGDYVFDSSRFQQMFGEQPTAYATGLAACLKHRSSSPISAPATSQNR